MAILNLAALAQKLNEERASGVLDNITPESGRLYRIHSGMKQRCSNPNNDAYQRYGARGIGYCPSWENFDTFLSWALSSGYSEDLTLDREDNDIGYSPENCRWAAMKQQANNTSRSTSVVGPSGETMTLAALSEASGLSYSTLYRRFKAGKCGEALYGAPAQRVRETCESRAAARGGLV